MARKRRKRRPAPRRKNARPLGRPSLVTPEGDPLVASTAVYRHTGVDEVRQILSRARDFGLGDEPGPAEGEGGVLHLMWYETRRGSPRPAAPIGRRILASLTLTPETLEIETISKQRLDHCRRRLERLLGERIHLLRTETKSMEQALAERSPEDEPEPVTLPPEAMADLEQQMLRRWIDESIPALDGMTPREAVQTPAGRQKVLDLLAYMERQQLGRPLPPGVFTPDYNKVKAMLGLE
jgi:hypothetical protein